MTKDLRDACWQALLAIDLLLAWKSSVHYVCAIPDLIYLLN